ncbi:MAG: hypothetical protein EHM28_07215 [Spirochaetaceae bacterium]|nr:MAG: hypothetical protein EHM28_07215 [Spirochaetaceae bacterium]
MKHCSYLVFEQRVMPEIPGITRSVSFASFPFWGNLHIADIHAGNIISVLHMADLWFFLEPDAAAETEKILRKWKKPEAISVLPAPASGKELLSWIRENKSELFLLASSGSLVLTDPDDFGRFLQAPHADIVKLTAQMSPMTMYLVKKKKLIALILGLKDEDSGKSAISSLFKRLDSDFETLEDLPGKMLYNMTIMELFSAHMSLLDSFHSPDYPNLAGRFSRLSPEYGEAYVGETGEVFQSFLAAGCEIHGTVKNSVLFPGVFIAQDTLVESSVVMTDNRIGPGSTIENAFIFPYQKQGKRDAYNISQGTKIGCRLKTAKNMKYPDQLNDGLSLIGMNTELPPGSVIGAACYIAPDLPSETLAGYNTARKGTCAEPKKSE